MPGKKEKRATVLLAVLAAVLVLSDCAVNPEKEPDSAQRASVPSETVSPTPSQTPRPSTAPTPTPTPTPTPSPSPIPEPANDEMVKVTDYVPGIYVELKYSTEDNFTGQVIYDFTDACLRYGTVKKLAEAQRELAEQGLSLKIWDAFRPVSAQFKLWEVCPNSTFVANPNTGYSSHSTGSTVDITIVTAEGDAVEMPTGFDDFTAAADRDYSDVSQTAAENARLLQNIMEAHGFLGYYNEWWHYSDSNAYPVYEQAI